jgi:molybdate transport system substrate-binding protein
MSHRTFWRALIFVLILVLGLAPVAAQTSETLTVFAAASLTDAFEDLATDFEAANPGVDILFNFAGSSDLAAQLSEGASADVFASANNRQMQAANDAGRIGGSPRTFVKNRLALIVPADNPANISDLRDLANEGVLLVLAAPSVPVRDYTNTMLDRLAADPSYGESYREAFLANVVSEEENVRAVAAKVALGEADAGIVYISDVTPDIAEQVIALPIPDALNTIATYPIAITDDATNPELAQAFVDYVLSDAGQATLDEWNFIPAKIPELPNTVTLPEVGTITLDGQVLNPLTLTVESLQTNFTLRDVEITSTVEGEARTTTYTGVLLWDLVSAAQPNINADVGGDAGSLYFVVTASDGYQVVLAWTQVAPAYTDDPVLVAILQDGELLTEAYAPAILVVPAYVDPSFYLYGLANLSLRDSPTVSE